MRKFNPKKIKEYREMAGMTQEALADKMGLHPQQISAWEREDIKGLTIRSLIKICEALKNTPNDYFEESST